MMSECGDEKLREKTEKRGARPSGIPQSKIDPPSSQGFQQIRTLISLVEMHRRGPPKKKKKKSPLNGNPYAKGVVIKTLIRKPKKPNSANRKCVLVRLSNGKEMTAYVPGVGHNLQEHNVVLCRVGRCKDVPGIKIKCVRGKYDLAHVMKRK